MTLTRRTLSHAIAALIGASLTGGVAIAATTAHSVHVCAGTPPYPIAGPLFPQTLDRDLYDSTHGVVVVRAGTTRSVRSTSVAGGACQTGTSVTLTTITADDVSFVPVPAPVAAPVTFG